MPRRDDDDDLEPEEEDEDLDEEEEYDDYKSGGRKRSRSQFIDDVAEEDEEEEDEDDDDDEDFDGGGGGGRRGGRGGGHKAKKRSSGSQFFDLEAAVDSDEDEEEEDGEDDFIEDGGADLPDEEDARRMHRRPLLREDDQEDVEALERSIQARYARSSHTEYDEETTDVEQQALLPSVRDPKLWMVKCAIGHEREVAVCLMQKCIDKGAELQIRSAIALDHLKNYIYIEADKEAHVREACKGMRNIFTGSKILLVPIKEMTDVLAVESKAIELSRDTWVRMKIGTYKGDLAKVVDVDNVRQRVTVKLIPRIDLQALANKLEGREVPKKKTFTPPPRFMNVDEAREMHIRVERRRDPMTGDYFENINGMMFKDGFLYKTVSMKSISTQSIQPSFDELEKFRQPGENGDGDMASLSTLFANRKKGHFMKGDRVIIVKGDLKNLKGVVEKVEEDTVHIKPYDEGLPKTLAVSEKELCKYFEPGNHVKVVSGATEGATGMVLTVERHLVNIVSDTTKEVIQVFSDNVVESSEVTSGKTRIGDYELHDLVLLDNMSFGVIIRVENEAFQVLKGVPDRPDVALVRLREIKYKIERKNSAQDRLKNIISVKDVVKVLEGPCKGKQGPVEHIFKGVLFIYDRHHLEHAGFICAKSQSCMVVGGSRANGDRNGDLASRFAQLRTPRVPQSPGRMPRGGPPINSGGRFRGGGRGHNSLIGTNIRVRLGPFKGYKGIVKDVKGPTVRVELESQMKIITVNRDQISDNVNSSTPFRETPRYGAGSETPMHPSRTPMHPYMTPMRDSGATPIHDGMRTPMRFPLLTYRFRFVTEKTDHQPPTLESKMSSLRVPSQIPPVAEDIEQLHKAFSGWGTNEGLIISILAHRNAAQRKVIRQSYAETYGEDLLKALDKELSNDFERVVLLWALDSAERDALLANEATKRWTKSNQVLVEIACTRSSQQLLAARQAYHTRFKKSLEEDVAYHTTGEFRKLLLPLVSSYRYEGDEVNMTLAKSEAKILHQKISEKAYSDDDLIRILASRSKAQINATLNQYKNEFGNDINKDLKADPKEEFLPILRATIKCLTFPEKYFEKVLRLAINKTGTDEGALTRVVTTRAEVDMETIKDDYHKRNSVPLDRAIGKDTTGDYEKMLLALIGHGDA